MWLISKSLKQKYYVYITTLAVRSSDVLCARKLTNVDNVISFLPCLHVFIAKQISKHFLTQKYKKSSYKESMVC